MIVQHNLQAMNANRHLGVTNSNQAKFAEKLSSGYKINRAADDAAGLAISEKMRRQIRGLTQAVNNAQDGVSAVQTAEGAMDEIHDMLHRLAELSVKGANGTLNSIDRAFISMEVKEIFSEIDRVHSTTTFNERALLDGSFTGVGLQVDAEASSIISLNISDLSASGLGLYDVSGDTIDGSGDPLAPNMWITDDTGSLANSLNANVKLSITKLSTQRAQLGAVQNRLEHAIKNLNNVVENTTSAEAAIRDTDMASAMVTYSNNSILLQAGQSMLAQANQANQGVLSLLGR